MELSYQTLRFTHQAREAVRKAYTIRNSSPLPAGRFLCPVAMATEAAALVAQAQSLGTRVEAGLRKESRIWARLLFDERDGRVCD